MKIAKHRDQKRLLRLAFEGKVAPALRQRWYKKFGRDPLDLAEILVLKNHAKFLRIAIPLTACVCLFGSVILIRATGSGDFGNALGTIFWGGLSSAIAFFALAANFFPAHRGYTDEEQRFILDAEEASTLASFTIVEFLKLDGRSLEEAARAAMVGKARESILARKSYDAQSTSDRLGKKAAAELAFQNACDLFGRLSILPKTEFGPYYKEAEELLAQEAAKMATTQQEPLKVPAVGKVPVESAVPEPTPV